MSDAMADVLRLVADGRLTAAEAAPILDALGAAGLDGPAPDDRRVVTTQREKADPPPGDRRPASAIRIEVIEGGRKVVNLRIPVSLGRMALDRIPGLSGSNVDLVRMALDEGRSGILLDVVDEDGGVRIALE